MNARCWCVEMKLWVGSEWILIHRLSGCHRTVKPTRHPHIMQLAWHCVLVAASAGASPLALTNSHPATCGSTHKSLFIARPHTPHLQGKCISSRTNETHRETRPEMQLVFTRPTWHLHHPTALGFVLPIQNEAFRRPVFFSFGTCQYRDYRRRGRRGGMRATTDTLMHTINPSHCTLELDETIDLASLWLLHLEGPTLFEPYELRSSRQPILSLSPLLELGLAQSRATI